MSHSVTRIIDDGAPFALKSLPPGFGAATLPDGSRAVLDTSACSNPDCLNLELTGWIATPVPDGTLRRADEPCFEARLDLADNTVSVPEDAPPGLADWLAAETETIRPRLRERLARIRGQDDREQWRRQDRALLEADAMVPYHEAFPLGWDLVVTFEGEPYWAMDSYCLNPGCPCREILLQFSHLARGRARAAVFVEVGRWHEPRIERGGKRARRIAQAVAGDDEICRELSRRQREMRRVAQAIGREREPRRRDSARVGRNDPCPCGSGRKYKRCCLGKG